MAQQYAVRAIFIISIMIFIVSEKKHIASNELPQIKFTDCLLYTSNAADDSLRVDIRGRSIIKKK